jgi:hypothetical protein
LRNRNKWLCNKVCGRLQFPETEELKACPVVRHSRESGHGFLTGQQWLLAFFPTLLSVILDALMLVRYL